jgi:hypothetical protein
MQQISENVILMEVGDPMPPEAGEFVKILLAGSIDLGNAGAENGGIGYYDWITKFSQGVASITDPIKGMLMLRGQKYLLVSTKYKPVNPMPVQDNPEFINTVSWTLDMAAQCDGIFINFLKRSTSTWPLMLFSLLSGSGKCVVRCPMEYQGYGFVKVIAERNNIPLLPSSTSGVYTVLSTMQAYIPEFNNIATQTNLSLPE